MAEKTNQWGNCKTSVNVTPKSHWVSDRPAGEENEMVGWDQNLHQLSLCSLRAQTGKALISMCNLPTEHRLLPDCQAP